MPQFNSLIGFLDSRSFVTVWYWLVLVGMWSVNGRSLLGVPTDVVARAQRELRDGSPDGAGVMALMDWLSLILPRWQLGRSEGAIFLALTSFALTSLFVFGFMFRLEMAQAVFILLFPFWVLFWMRAVLAAGLSPILSAAQNGALPLDQAGPQVVRRMVTHRRLVSLLSILSVAGAAIWGTIWALMHPNGL
ncbi:hypothetical protein [Paracoccus sp. (in: a-proteobacteria)]|uniref:hypothetical protein n=1 Tax=Paracoccus sp. TaxID=267 RepID=UPI0026E0177F|nr:hypothetical protein [Paracoccus sp. (in: a-proteobacteria)]MDO5646479.1 hypothetical protein [Paracoccus sp. (in: a-proteobacteria)]